MAANDLSEGQNQLRLQNIGCDVIFEIGAKSFPAHRVVLMARIEHFRNMFTADMREKKELTVQFDPLIIHPDFFGEVLEYIYTSKITFKTENIRAIHKAADYFCFDELVIKAKEYMKSSLNIENAILYRNISVEFNLEALENDCEQLIINNSSSAAIKRQLIPTLSFEELTNFVSKLKKAKKFEEMFTCSVDWILKDKVNRAGVLMELMKNIPLEKLSFRFLKQNVANNELVLKDNGCLNLLLSALITIHEPFDSGENALQNESLYAIGGKDGERLSSVSEFNSVTQIWTATTPMPNKLSHFGCAVVGKNIYACGGFDEDRSMNELTVFDTDAQTWTQLTPMKHARQNCGVVVLDRHIYVAGGTLDNENLTVVEQYSVQTGVWQDVASMTVKRNAPELVVLNGFLYAIGGHDGNDILNSVERYDPRTDQWTLMNNTINKYQAFGSAVLNGFIYIVGRDKCEVYSPADDQWTEMPAPSQCNYGRRMVVYNSKLYVVGGMVGETKDWKGIKTVEVFDFQARVWRQEPDMDVARCLHALAVVKTG